MHTYNTHGTCSRQIMYNVENGVVTEVRFIGGCMGNLQGISKLVEGRKIEEIIPLLEGIKCRNGTSCPDQLSKALKQHIENQ